jgi:hypothetical protein
MERYAKLDLGSCADRLDWAFWMLLYPRGGITWPLLFHC